MNIFISGINGGLGLNTAINLYAKGYDITGYGHAPSQIHPIIKQINFVEGDLADKTKLKKAISRSDVIMHFGGLTGFGHSLSDYVNSNILGTTNILEIITEEELSVKQFIFASSSAVYGEGSYSCDFHGISYPISRKNDELKTKHWEYYCDICGEILKPIPTKEDKALTNRHIYALTKQTCENIINEFSKMYNITSIILRFSILYGINQAKGILPLFIKNISNGKTIKLNEDGLQIRDYIFLEDAAEIVERILKSNQKTQTYNVCNATPTSLVDLVTIISDVVKMPPKIKVTNKFRDGDIRHIYLDNKKLLNDYQYTFKNLNEGVTKMLNANYG